MLRPAFLEDRQAFVQAMGQLCRIARAQPWPRIWPVSRCVDLAPTSTSCINEDRLGPRSPPTGLGAPEVRSPALWCALLLQPSRTTQVSTWRVSGSERRVLLSHHHPQPIDAACPSATAEALAWWLGPQVSAICRIQVWARDPRILCRCPLGQIQIHHGNAPVAAVAWRPHAGSILANEGYAVSSMCFPERIGLVPVAPVFRRPSLANVVGPLG